MTLISIEIYNLSISGDLLLTLALISVFVAIFLLLIAYWATVITTVQNHRSVEFVSSA